MAGVGSEKDMPHVLLSTRGAAAKIPPCPRIKKGWAVRDTDEDEDSKGLEKELHRVKMWPMRVTMGYPAMISVDED